MKQQTVLIVGASSDPSRYSNKALISLKENRHKVVLINPTERSIMGQSVFKNIQAAKDSGILIDTVTMYVNPKISKEMEKELVALKPKRVIFNPGTENPQLEKSLKEAGIQVEEACTLVMLKTNQF